MNEIEKSIDKLREVTSRGGDHYGTDIGIHLFEMIEEYDRLADLKKRNKKSDCSTRDKIYGAWSIKQESIMGVAERANLIDSGGKYIGVGKYKEMYTDGEVFEEILEDLSQSKTPLTAGDKELKKLIIDQKSNYNAGRRLKIYKLIDKMSSNYLDWRKYYEVGKSVERSRRSAKRSSKPTKRIQKSTSGADQIVRNMNRISANINKKFR